MKNLLPLPFSLDLTGIFNRNSMKIIQAATNLYKNKTLRFLVPFVFLIIRLIILFW